MTSDLNKAKFNKVKTLLLELFQLDQPDLDFGIYRIMHARSAEVTQFLDKDLLPQVAAAFGEYQPADKAEIEKELVTLKAGIAAAGMDEAGSPKVKELEARLKNDSVDVTALESDVYDHLYSFFRRYYSDGDFLAKRVYKAGVYAIPYEGEEVTLHWANKDQYYVKTSEYLRDYAFRLRPDDIEKPMRVHFRLTDATEGEHGNVKAAEGKTRVFILAAPGDSGREFISEESGGLVVRFEYRPATLNDWPDDARAGKTKPPGQKELSALAAKRILGATGATLAAWATELGRPHVTSSRTADYSRLEAHIRRYTARNTFDYFIHKDLGGFLRRELDFYVKNEVMHLDDVENESATRVAQYLSKVKVIRKIAGKIIDFLAQLEDFQKKLWLKKKFVVETQYCITLDRIPQEFYAEIVANDAQRQEWVRLFAIDGVKADLAKPGYSVPLTLDFLKAHTGLVLDTKHFSTDFVARLVASQDAIDARISGVVFHAENLQALSLASRRYSGAIACTYIDPPYNTGSDDNFPYKDQYQHSTWLSLIADRLAAARGLLAQHGMLFGSIGLEEHGAFDLVLRDVFGESNKLAELAWEKGRKNDARRFSVGHDYILAYARDAGVLDAVALPWREPKPGVRPIIDEYHRLKKVHARNLELMSVGLASWFAGLPADDPSRKYQRSKNVDARGIWRDNNISWPGGGGPRYDVLHPATGKPCVVPRDGWRFIEETMRQKIADDFVVFREDHTESPFLKSYLYIDGGDVGDDDDDLGGQPQVMGSVFYRHSQPSNDWMKDLFGMKAFSNPKDHEILARLFRYVTPTDGTVLDFFAGSGSTGHAVIDLNRAPARSERKFVLVEVGDHFDLVLMPRLKKAAYAQKWSEAKPVDAVGVSQTIKYLRLESYEDALNNLESQRTSTQQLLLNTDAAQGADGMREQYVLKYMLDVETRASNSLLNVRAFADPTAYKLKIKRPGSDESRVINVDLVETFNWLVGHTVNHIAAPQTFTAAFERDGEKRLRLKGHLKQAADGPYWFRTVLGLGRDGRKTLVVWRKLTGELEHDNLVLDEWFTKQGYSAKDNEFGLIYVNGDNNLENLKAPDDTWKVRLIEEDFHRLMFEMEGL